MKAWKVDDGPDSDWCLLVYAPTRARAKMFYLVCHPSIDGIAFIAIRALRAPLFDDLSNEETAIGSNAGLPAGMRFYTEENG